jgi:hypothetical protein
MSSVITYNSAAISDSITNPDVDKSAAADNSSPYSFLQFITITRVDYTPDEYNNFYISYLKDWAIIKNTNNTTEQRSFVEYYVEFLKEIVLTYATNQERKFLSTINFDDPADLDVAIPFFTDKIRQIILFYKSKRDDAKYVIDRNKIKGSTSSIERGLFDNIYNYIFAAQDQPQYSDLGKSLTTISETLDINILEYVDVYGNYFDIPNVPKSTETNQQRIDYYTANINEVDTALFLSDSYQQIFGSTAFLNEIPLIVNVTLKFDAICNTDNPLALLQNNDISGLSTSDIIVYRKKLLEKYLGADLHYIDTSNNTTVTGILVRAETPSNNINNLQQANTATVQSNEAILLRNLGLFFNTDSQGIFQLNANNFTYSIDYTKLEPNKIYIFPDPNKYGNVTINNQLDYPLVYIYDYRYDVKNVSSGFASGVPKINSNDQTFSPYYASEQSHTQSITNDINLNFSDLYNKGYITALQYDVYGNSYALFKDALGHTFKSVETLEDEAIKSLLLDGHVFRDDIEGVNFNYDTVSVVGDTFRSGLSTNTIGIGSVSASSYSSFSSPYYTLFFREFTPYIELLQSSRNIIPKIRDAGEFTFADNVALPDSYFTSNSSYNTGNYYYNELAEGGVISLDPPLRAIDTSTTLSASFGYDVRLVLSAANVEEYNCGYYSDNVIILNDNNYKDQVPYNNTVYNYGLTVLSTLSGIDELKIQAEKDRLQGTIFVQQGTNTLSTPISTALTNTFSKYSASVRTEVYTAAKNLEIFYNTICIETPNYLVFDKVLYEDGSFQKPYTSNLVYSISSISTLQAFSNRLFIEKDKTVTFCVMYPRVLSASVLITESTAENIIKIYNNNNKIFIPDIYQYNITDNSVEKIFPVTSQVPIISSMFTLSAVFNSETNFNIVQIQKPIITYNTLNDLYKLTYICTDNNNLFHLLDYSFKIDQNKVVTFIDSKYYNHSNTIRTSDFVNSTFVTIKPNLGTYTLSGNQIII